MVGWQHYSHICAFGSGMSIKLTCNRLLSFLLSFFLSFLLSLSFMLAYSLESRKERKHVPSISSFAVAS